MTNRPATVTLHGFLPPAAPTLELEVSIRTQTLTNGFTGEVESHQILRAANGIYTYEWRLESVSGFTDEDRVGQPGGFWITGFATALERLRPVTGETISESDIEALRAEAAEADDIVHVAYCELALARNPDRDDHVRRARQICADVINNARAMDDDPAPVSRPLVLRKYYFATDGVTCFLTARDADAAAAEFARMERMSGISTMAALVTRIACLDGTLLVDEDGVEIASVP